MPIIRRPKILKKLFISDTCVFYYYIILISPLQNKSPETKCYQIYDCPRVVWVIFSGIWKKVGIFKNLIFLRSIISLEEELQEARPEKNR